MVDPPSAAPSQLIVVEDLGLGPDEQALYDAAEAECGPNTPSESVVDWTLANDIEGQMIAISNAAKRKPGFAAINKAYKACIHGKGLDFDDPDLLLDLVKKKYAESPDGTAVADFERTAAAADSECRVDLWPAFLELSTAEWKAFTRENQQRSEAVVNGFAALQEEARDLLPSPTDD